MVSLFGHYYVLETVVHLCSTPCNILWLQSCRCVAVIKLKWRILKCCFFFHLWTRINSIGSWITGIMNIHSNPLLQ